MTEYNQKEIEDKIHKSLFLLRKNDSFLIKNNVNERSLTHKLAEYLQNEFSEYHVDCEYNRCIDNPKYLKIQTEECLSIKTEKVLTDDIRAKIVYPDIVVHKRGEKDNNLVAIEVKKHTNQNPKDVKFDKQKLEAFGKDERYKYKFCYFVVIGENSDDVKRVTIK